MARRTLSRLSGAAGVMRIRIDAPAVIEVRVSPSPLWELFSSLSCLASSRTVTWPYGDWCRTAERAVVDRHAIELLGWFRRLPGPLPTVLTPVPVPAANPGLADELSRVVEALRDAPDEVFARVASWPKALPPPRETWLRWFTAAVHDYWRAVIEPHWLPMRSALDDEVAARARVLATRGAGDMLGELGSRIRWRPPVLELPGQTSPRDLHCTRALVVVPLIFGLLPTRCVSDDAGSVAISCPSRGASVLAPERGAAHRSRGPERGDEDALVLLLGRGRASVVRRLVTPGTTSDLAEQVGVSASTVSQHLATLLAAGVASKRRVGACVLYALTDSGVALIKSLEPPSKRNEGKSA